MDVTRRAKSVDLSLTLTRRPSPSLPRRDVVVVGGGVHGQDEVKQRLGSASDGEGKKIVPRKTRMRLWHDKGGEIVGGLP
jgi:hypothetical protein